MNSMPQTFLLLLLVVTAGCQRQLMPTPNLYAESDENPWAELPSELQGTTVDVLYLTDREPRERSDGRVTYGYGRSWSLAFGSVEVQIGNDATWEELVAASRTHKRTGSWPVKVTSITEMIRFPKSPFPFIEHDGEIFIDPDVDSTLLRTKARFEDEIRRRLALTPHKNVSVFVHGFHNTFDYAAGILAEFWHMAGRRGVPILYSWPAGSPGLLRGYTYDRESGQFTIFHLKAALRALADISEIQRINVIAHSRGTDVAASALRELLIESRAAGLDPRQRYRIGEVVLAAPDIDFDVMSQRFTSERFFLIAERVTIYASKKDQAIGLAGWLYSSRERIGRLEPEDLDPYTRALLAEAKSVAIVNAQVKTGSLGHAYFHSSPAVSSDLLLTVGEHAAPGSAQRPLVEVIPGYWVLDDEAYPFVSTD